MIFHETLDYYARWIFKGVQLRILPHYEVHMLSLLNTWVNLDVEEHQVTVSASGELTRKRLGK